MQVQKCGTNKYSAMDKKGESVLEQMTSPRKTNEENNHQRKKGHGIAKLCTHEVAISTEERNNHINSTHNSNDGSQRKEWTLDERNESKLF